MHNVKELICQKSWRVPAFDDMIIEIEDNLADEVWFQINARTLTWVIDEIAVFFKLK